MGTSVGAVWLDLNVTNSVVKQIKEIAKQSEAPATAAFKGVGDTVSKAISEPVEQAGKDIERILERNAAAAKRAAKAIKTETGALFVDETGGKKSALASQILSSQSSAKEKAAESPKINVQGLRASADTVELLNQELDNTLARLRLQELEVDKLTAAYAKIPSTDLGSDAAQKLEAKLASAESRLLSLQKAANSAQTKIDKALQPQSTPMVDETKTISAAQNVKAAVSRTSDAVNQKVKSTSDKSAGVVRKAMQSAGNSISGAFRRGGTAANKQLQSIGRKASGLSRSIKSAFKSAFLMASLYAAFRGIKSLIGDTIGQNEEFTKSLQAIKANLLVAFTPIMQAIQPALNALASGFAAVSRQIATVTAGLFGQTYAQAAAATKKMQAVNKEAKKARSSMSFDEMTLVSSGEPGSSGNSTNLTALDTAQYGDAAKFGTTVKTMLGRIASSIGPLMASIASKVAENAPAVVTAATGIVTSLLAGFNDNAPAIIQSGISILQTLISGMQAVLPELGPFIVNAITLLTEGFLVWVPNLIAMGATLLSSVLTGLAEKIPELIPMAQTAIMTIIQSVTDNLPAIINAGMEILTSLIYGISDMLPALLPAAMECILTLVEGLVDNLPQLIDAAIVLITSLAQGLIDALPILIAKAPVIIKKLVDGLVDAIPKLVDAAINIIMGLVDFLIDNLPLILESAVEIVITLAYGLISAIPKLLAAVPKLIKALVDKIMGTDWLQVGKDIISGIGSGLLKGVAGIGDTIKNAASGIVSGFKKFFGIKSPSRLFRDVVGANLALGIGEGFEDEMDGVGKDMQKAIPVPELANMTIPAGSGSTGGGNNILEQILAAILQLGRNDARQIDQQPEQDAPLRVSLQLNEISLGTAVLQGLWAVKRKSGRVDIPI